MKCNSMSLMSSSIGSIRCLSDEEADNNMLQDLQLAAELGKTLLERNKELENCIKLHQCTIDDQIQEIEYMKKQTAALKEVNDSRLKIYEQLEVSIQDLERANHRLALENTNDKKQIKSQSLTIDNLEARIDELQKKYDELNKQYEALQREQQTKTELSVPKPNLTPTSVQANIIKTTPPCDVSIKNVAELPRQSSVDVQEDYIQQLVRIRTNDEDVTNLLQQLYEARIQRAREQKKVAELKEQMDSIVQEHAHMEEQLNHWRSKAEDMKNLQDEINTLEEVRNGHLCGRCLRGTDFRAQDELSVMLDQEEDDEISLAESFSESLRDVDTTIQELSQKSELIEEENGNPYRVLVEKYEALLKVQQHLANQRRIRPGSAVIVPALTASTSGCMSLQEELQMSGEFSTFNSAQSEVESNYNQQNRMTRVRNESCIRGGKKSFTGTPTDFSEAETSSSGYSDEISNKATQTEGRPGSFLCSIADGEDCKFSIYDDSSTFDGRFHQTPEYRKLFSEIFEVLKRAAAAKDEGTQLPLLDDSLLISKSKNSNASAFTLLEDAPSDMTDETRSIVSLAASEPVFRMHTPILGRKDESRSIKQDSVNEPSTADNKKSVGLRAVVHNNARRQPLEYLSVQVRKKGSIKKSRHQSNSETSVGPADVIPSPNPRTIHQLKSGSRRRSRQLHFSDVTDGFTWNGNTTHFYPSKSPRAARHQQPSNNVATTGAQAEAYKPGTASEEVAKLRRLEMSYAEVLRMPNKAKGIKNHNSKQRKDHH